MKIKQIKQKSYKLLNFNLAKTKILRKNHYLKGINIEDIEFRLKKIFNLIYLYHISNKKILFVGNPMKINTEIKSIFSKTKHIFIPKSAWVKGIITNQFLYFKSLFKFKKKKSLITPKLLMILQLKTKFDLIVIMDQESDFKALEESHKSNIPVITLNSNLNIFNYKASYKVPGNFIESKNKLRNNIFYSILLSTLKKAKFFRNKRTTKFKTKFTNRFTHIFTKRLPYELTSIKKIKKSSNYKNFKTQKNYKKNYKKNKKKQFYAVSKKK